MEKRYTVKEVIKMEDKMRYLAKVGDDAERYDYYYFPLMLLFSMGLMLSMGYGREYTSILPLLFGSFSALSGIGPLGYLMAAAGRSDRLYDKVTEIYENMGPEFKEQVKQERMRLEAEKENEKSISM